MSDLEDTLAWQMHVAGITGYVREHRFAYPRRWRFDFAWTARKIAVEVDGATWSGGRHARGAGIESDAEKHSTAAAMGWRVLRVTRAMVDDGRALLLIERALGEAAA